MPSPLRLLSTESLQQIHKSALRILERTGMQIAYAPALERLAAAGARVDGSVVRFPADLVEASLAQTPRPLTYHGRTAAQDITLAVGGSLTARVPGGATNFIDLETGENRRARIEDWKTVARLQDALPNVGLIATMHCGDVPARTSDVHSVKALLESTHKCFIHNAFTAENQRVILEMLDVVAGGKEALAARPFMHHQSSVISPLFLNADDAEQIMTAVEWGIPLDLPLMSIVAVSSPITLAGTLAQGVAEYLAPLVLAQVMRPGHPFAFFIDPVAGDMRTGAALFAAPESALLVAAISQIGTELYGFPAQAIGLDSDGFSANQTMFQKAQMLAFQVMAGGTHIVGAGSVESCMALSPLQLVIDDELMLIAKRWAKGVEVNDEALALEAVDRVGPRGSFLMDDHTMAHLYEGELIELPLAERESRQVWENSGRKTMETKARSRARQLLASHQPPEMSPEAAREIQEIVARADRAVTR